MASRFARFKRVGDWLDERTGFRGVMRAALDEPVRGGARWSYVWGSCLVFALIVQMVTGVVMASSYSPSVTTAWASVAYMNDQMTLGWFVRGLHSAGASAMVILAVIHLLQVALFGAYKRPREVNWILGVMMLGLIFAFALTGYLLPWDQKGYWATQVATSLLGATPLVGRGILKLVLGGESYGNLTLTRFYALHVFVLPAAMVLLTTLHIALFRKHGVTPSWRGSDEELAKRTVPFWPDQLLRDLAAMAALFGLMAWWVFRSHGADLEAPADPTSSYDARPEWYFLPLFQLLKHFPGAAEIPAAMGAPLILFGTLLALPFLDRGPDRSPSKRKRYLAAVGLIFAGAIGLGLEARQDDAHSEGYRAQRERADRDAARARELAREGVLPAGGLAVWENDPDFKARKLLGERCLGCHLYQGAGENRAPSLDGWSSRAWIAGMLRDPDHPNYYGKTKIHDMKPVKGGEAQVRALVEFVFAQGGPQGVDEALRARGEELFGAMDCDSCHDSDGTGANQGPNMGGRASADWLRAFLRDPSEGRFFGKQNAMPKFGDRLAPSEIDVLVRLLVSERAKK
ncbi:MAG: c-type cytochrome [Myxococcales bacterium]|nr:c-type cytochrome [Myxococcales bacterium]